MGIDYGTQHFSSSAPSPDITDRWRQATGGWSSAGTFRRPEPIDADANYVERVAARRSPSAVSFAGLSVEVVVAREALARLRSVRAMRRPRADSSPATRR